MLIRYAAAVFLAFIVSPVAMAQCWKLKDGSYVTSSKSPGTGARKTLSKYCANSGSAANQTPAPNSTRAPNSTPVPLTAWVGSPVSGGVWAPLDGTQLPANHHTPRYKDTPNYRGDWSVDIDADAPDPVAVYAAPKYGQRLTASVSKIGDACPDPKEGGKRVHVDFALDRKFIGTVVYSHLTPKSNLKEGSSVKVWGGTIGTVYDGDVEGSCWSGTHVHVELYSKQEKSCWSKEWRQGGRVGLHDFIGFLGQTGMGSKKAACP